jgi:CheY-like chemotaxis protein
LLEGRPITFATQVGEGAEVLVTDPIRLRQILNNLLSNAAKFTVGGAIEVAARRSGDTVVVSVIDTGVGIEGEELATIFTPFYRGSARARAPTRGMGLGLAIAQEITHLLGGRMEVESRVGEGSTFHLVLPVGEVEAGVAADSERSVDMSDASVLLIEDDEVWRAQMVGVLGRAGAQVIEARDGLEGLRRARERRPDVVVLDLGLPRVQGVEVLARLKGDRALAGVPVVVATGDPDEHLEAHCRKAGCAAYVVKGETPHDVLRAIVPLVGSERSFR